jgi:hypothetical protein
VARSMLLHASTLQVGRRYPSAGDRTGRDTTIFWLFPPAGTNASEPHLLCRIPEWKLSKGPGTETRAPDGPWGEFRGACDIL